MAKFVSQPLAGTHPLGTTIWSVTTRPDKNTFNSYQIRNKIRSLSPEKRVKFCVFFFHVLQVIKPFQDSFDTLYNTIITVVDKSREFRLKVVHIAPTLVLGESHQCKRIHYSKSARTGRPAETPAVL